MRRGVIPLSTVRSELRACGVDFRFSSSSPVSRARLLFLLDLDPDPDLDLDTAR